MVTINIPSATSTLGVVDDYSAPFFTEYALGIIGVVMGLAIAGLAVNWLTRNGLKLVKSIFGGRRKKR